MTLVVALQGRDGLLLAADSRGTIGDPRGLTAIADDHQKLFKLSQYCGIGVSGASELAATIIDRLVAQVEVEKLVYADDILDKTREFVRQCYADWFPKTSPEQRQVMVFTLVGYHEKQGTWIPRIYLLASPLDFAPQLCNTGRMLAGIPQYATYLVHRLYDQAMGIEDLARLAAYLIAETATQDPKVGGPIRMAKIKPHLGYQEIAKQEIGKIVEGNNLLNEQLRKVFYKGYKGR